jgi:hypothetical protein
MTGWYTDYTLYAMLQKNIYFCIPVFLKNFSQNFKKTQTSYAVGAHTDHFRKILPHPKVHESE